MLYVVLAAVVACTATEHADPADRGLPATTEVVTFETDDGVTLAADWLNGSATAVILFHMVPPTYDRTSWPAEVVTALRDEDGHSVLVVDRRGAGESEGNARDAYNGAKGVKDAWAAVDFVTDNGCDRVLLVGASNGTTTVLDYVADPGGRPAPAAVVWMSPGGYTTNNSRISSLEGTARAMLVYPEAESDWPESTARPADPGTWTFVEYAGSSHGTGLFGDGPDAAADLRAFLAEG